MPFELHFTRIFWKSQFAKSSVSRIITKALIYDIYSSIVITVIIIVISIIIVIIIISNSNWTEWSTIQGVIARVISKLRARLLPELFGMRSNYLLIVSMTNFGIKNVL